MEVEVRWSGKYPNLCMGEWTLEIDGKDVSNKIPKELRNKPMDTYNIYERVWLGKDWSEEWERYEDGLDPLGWIKENEYWLNNITTDSFEQEEI